MSNKIGSIDNDGNMTSYPLDDEFNNMTAPNNEISEKDSNEVTLSDEKYDIDENNYNNDEEFDVFGNSNKPKRTFNKKLLLIPIVVLLILLLVFFLYVRSNNKYTVNTKALVVKVDETKKIGITAKNKVKEKLTYSSDNQKVASVDSNGKVTGKSIGTTVVYVGINGKKSKKVNVKVETNKEELELKETNITIEKGQTHQLEIKKVLEDDVFQWSSSNENVATVTESGLVAGIHAGTATIVVRESDGRSVSTRVFVKSDEILINDISLQDQTIAIGEKITLKPTINPSNGLKIFSWQSSKESIAKVDANGVVTGVAKGTATITVETHNGKTARAKITVDDTIPASIKLSGCTGGIAINTPISLNVVYTPSTAKSNVTWTSSNVNVATVSNGRVTARKTGNVTITATTKNGKKATCSLKVSPMSITKLTVSPTTMTLDQQSKRKISVNVTPSTAKNYYKIKFVSSNRNVATVDSNGQVTGINPGKATITATAGGKSAKVTVSVNATAVTGISLSGCNTKAKALDSFNLTATVKPASAKNRTVTWTSSNKNIATVSSGRVNLLSTGTVTITASTSNGKKAVCNIVVTKPDIKSLTMSNTSVSLKVGNSKIITAQTNLNTTNFNKFYKMSWRVANPDIVQITPSTDNSLRLTIKALKKGNTTIHGTVGTRTQSIQVIVT